MGYGSPGVPSDGEVSAGATGSAEATTIDWRSGEPVTRSVETSVVETTFSEGRVIGDEEFDGRAGVSLLIIEVAMTGGALLPASESERPRSNEKYALNRYALQYVLG
ncbi:hypothetical protein R1sor_020613 [Riccia sorocarpa]|uniref:Uncharacterized protein n=1 Tax=Riccia sorocarpa TaxID=122646 RepID=A0ABD3GEN2_9MARC